MKTKKLRLIYTGATGQLGCSLSALAKEYDTSIFFVPCTRKTLDLTSPSSFDLICSNWAKDAHLYSATVIINGGAYTAVDKAEEEQELCFLINAHSVRSLYAAAQKFGFGFIQIGSDYVFNGTLSIPYTEQSTIDPLSIYGHSKALAEKLLLEEENNSIHQDLLIVRTQWLYSPYGKNFVKTMLSLSQTHKELNVVADQIGCPTYAPTLARDLIQMSLYYAREGKFRTPLLHYRNSGITTWYDFATLTIAWKEILKKTPLSDLSTIVHPITTEQYPTPAQRPRFSLLDISLLQKVYQISPTHWSNDLARCISSLYNSTPDLFM